MFEVEADLGWVTKKYSWIADDLVAMATDRKTLQPQSYRGGDVSPKSSGLFVEGQL